MIIIQDNENNFYQNEATVLDSKKFEIKYPFGFLKNIKLSTAIVRVGISYGKSQFSYQNVTFFDSKCRTCKNGKVDTEPVNH